MNGYSVRFDNERRPKELYTAFLALLLQIITWRFGFFKNADYLYAILLIVVCSYFSFLLIQRSTRKIDGRSKLLFLLFLIPPFFGFLSNFEISFFMVFAFTVICGLSLRDGGEYFFGIKIFLITTALATAFLAKEELITAFQASYYFSGYYGLILDDQKYLPRSTGLARILAVIFLAFIPLLLLKSIKFDRSLFGLIAFLIVLLVLISLIQSRGVILALFGSILFYFFVIVKRISMPRKVKFFIFSLGVICAVGSLFFILKSGRFNEISFITGSGRLEIWREVISLSSPSIFGFGPSMEKILVGFNISNGLLFGYFAHGVVGIVCGIGLYLMLIELVWREFIRTSTDFADESIAFASILVFFIIRSLTENSFFSPGLDLCILSTCALKLCLSCDSVRLND